MIIDNERKAFGEAGLIEVVVDIIKTYTNNTNICCSGCNTLGSIVLGNRKYLFEQSIQYNEALQIS